MDESVILSEEQQFFLLKSMIEAQGLVSHEIEPFEHFMDNLLPNIIADRSTLRVEAKNKAEIEIIFSNMTVPKPMIKDVDGMLTKITPQNAMDRGLTYSSPVFIDITQINYLPRKDGTKYKAAHYNFKQVVLFEMPIMTNSKYCHRSEHSDPTLTIDDNDPGGVFIVNGTERSLICQEKMRYNFPLIMENTNVTNKYAYSCECRSAHKSMRSTSTIHFHMTSTKGGAYPLFYAGLPWIKYDIPIMILFRVLGINSPEAALALIVGTDSKTTNTTSEGTINDYDWTPTTPESDAICNFFKSEHIRFLIKNLLEHDHDSSQPLKEVLIFIGAKGTTDITKEKRFMTVLKTFHAEFLPHLGITPTNPRPDGEYDIVSSDHEMNLRKAHYVAHVIRRMILRSYGQIPCDDRDGLSMKRAETSGVILAMFFRQYWKTWTHKTETTLLSALESGKYVSIVDVIQPAKISRALKSAFSTGNFSSSKKASSAQHGICQIISRLGWHAALSHLRRIDTPLNREGKNTKPRQLSLKAWGYECLHETPEGEAVGLVQQLAISTMIRIGFPSDTILKEVCAAEGFVSLSNLSTQPVNVHLTHPLVFVNGNVVGVASNPTKLREYLRVKRRTQEIPYTTSISYKRTDNEFHVNSDAGCLVRPVLVLDKLPELHHILSLGKSPSDTWMDLVFSGCIEYMDKEEEQTWRVAVRIEDALKEYFDYTALGKVDDDPFTHVEIHPLVIMGVMSSLIPFSDRNSAPRNMYQCSMGKQSIGAPTNTYPQRMDNLIQVLHYPQKPIVHTWCEKIITPDLLTGVNVVCLVTVYKGYGQEDAVILKKDAVERGLFVSTKYHTFKVEEKQMGGTDMEKICKPNPSECIGMHFGNYDKLDADGIVPPGTRLKANDAIVGKVLTTDTLKKNSKGEKIKRDQSIFVRNDCVVDRVMITENKAKTLTVKVRTYEHRIPVIGDKFSSRHSQKGICSLIVPEIDLPRTACGITPDIIIDPHCLPSRMTVAHVLEMMLGRAAVETGKYGDATPWKNLSISDISEVLKLNGVDRFCNERMYCGMTGELMDEKNMYMGVIFYNRLKHMVEDKYHSRGLGPVMLLTRQPSEGRSKGGGLRLGCMESGALMEHGAASFAKDRLFEQSDYYECDVCATCGLIAAPKKPKFHVQNIFTIDEKPFCLACRSNENIYKVALPYACKLMIQEIAGFNISMRLDIEIPKNVSGIN